MEEFVLFMQQYAIFSIAIICFMIGYVIKHYIAAIPNKYIPLILAVCGLFINLYLNNWDFTLQNVLVGIGSGVAATGGFEAVRELLGKKNEQ